MLDADEESLDQKEENVNTDETDWAKVDGWNFSFSEPRTWVGTEKNLEKNSNLAREKLNLR